MPLHPPFATQQPFKQLLLSAINRSSKKMDLFSLIVFILFLVRVQESQLLTAHAFNCNDTTVDMEVALCDMRSESYYGFSMLLRMVDLSFFENSDWTFFMPNDEELSAYPISKANLEDFILRHAIPKPLLFSDLARFPTGTFVPSGAHGKLLHIQNHGRSGFFVNNAEVERPNMCLDSQIKCHGIDAVIITNATDHPQNVRKHKKLPRSHKPKSPSTAHS